MKLNNKILSILLCFFLCLNPNIAIADDVPIETIEVFDTFPLETLINGKLYSGVLMSEVEYGRVIQNEVKLLDAEQKLKIYTDWSIKSEKLEEKWEVFVNNINKDLSLLKKEAKSSFWDENKAIIGFITGVVLTITIVELTK